MKTKAAYVIRTGTIHSAFNISQKLRSWATARRAVRAAKRMGYSDAYAAKLMVSADSILK